MSVAYACSKIGLFDIAEQYFSRVEICFPPKKETHPEFATFLRKKTEVVLDSLELNWPLDDQTVQKILSQADTDLARAEEILSNSLGRDHRQFALTKKEIARLKILMGFNEIALKEMEVLIPNASHHLNADFLLVRNDAEKNLGLNMTAQDQSLKQAEAIYRQTFGDNHPMVVFTLQKLCTAYLVNPKLANTIKAYEYFKASEEACQELRTNLREQLDSCQNDFLGNYNINTHPIVERQQLLNKRFTARNQGAW